MDLVTALKSFARIVERGSITAAAKDLGVSQPAVTKQLRNLEHYVGARLLERSSRVVRPTAQGQMLYEASSSALSLIEAAVEGVRRDMGTIEGLVRVTAPTCLGTKHLHPIIMKFQKDHPKVSVDLILENRDIDVLYENFDLAIKYGRPEAQDQIVRRIGYVRRILVASPKYLAEFGPIEAVEQLSNARLVITPAILSRKDMVTLQSSAGALDVPVRTVLRTNNADVIVQTLLTGHAAGPVQHLLIAEHLGSGRLIRILPDYEVKPTEAFLVYPSNRFMRPVVRALTDTVVHELRGVEGISLQPDGVIPSLTLLPLTA